MLKNKLMKEVWMNTWKYQEVINNEQKNPFSLKSTFLTLQQQILKFLLISQLRHGMDVITKIKYFQNMLWKFPITSQQQFCPWSTGVSAITNEVCIKTQDSNLIIWLWESFTPRVCTYDFSKTLQNAIQDIYLQASPVFRGTTYYTMTTISFYITSNCQTVLQNFGNI